MTEIVTPTPIPALAPVERRSPDDPELSEVDVDETLGVLCVNVGEAVLDAGRSELCHRMSISGARIRYVDIP